MKIRKEQLDAMQEVRLPEFEDRMVEHLAKFSPLHTKSLGEKGIRVLIRAGMQRAENHGFTRRGPVKFYIECTIFMGIDFDTDPQYAQAAEILADSSIADQTERADRVHAWLMELLAAAGGPDRKYAREALKRARKMSVEPIPVSSPTFESQIFKRMEENHPEKVAYLGETRLLGLVPRAIKEAKKYSISNDAGVCFLLGLMFAVGHGVAGDPKYPWISKTLNNRTITDPEKRVERLYSKTMIYLDHVLQHLEAK